MHKAIIAAVALTLMASTAMAGFPENYNNLTWCQKWLFNMGMDADPANAIAILEEKPLVSSIDKYRAAGELVPDL